VLDAFSGDAVPRTCSRRKHSKSTSARPGVIAVNFESLPGCPGRGGLADRFGYDRRVLREAAMGISADWIVLSKPQPGVQQTLTGQVDSNAGALKPCGPMPTATFGLLK
jgi:hypothetical protein